MEHRTILMTANASRAVRLRVLRARSPMAAPLWRSAPPGGAVRPRRSEADAAADYPRRRNAAVDDPRFDRALATSVACCAIADAVVAREEPTAPLPVPAEALRLAVPQSFVLDDLAPEVATAFDDACTGLSRAGARIVDLPLIELGEYGRSTPRSGSPRSKPMPGIGLCWRGTAKSTTRGCACASNAAAA